MMMGDDPLKKERGQFYSVHASYILQDLASFVHAVRPRSIIEPFAGNGDLLAWITQQRLTVESQLFAYDIDPRKPFIIQRDTLLSPPDYRDAWVITNPPYLARNKSVHKHIFDRYRTNDLYKCFLCSILDANVEGGILILPLGFFVSIRSNDVKLRHRFMSSYHVHRVNYFEEAVFPDTNTTIVAFVFHRATRLLESQDVLWVRFKNSQKQGMTTERPEQRVFHMTCAHDWIIGGDIYQIPWKTGRCRVHRYVQGKSCGRTTHLTLCALDIGRQRIRMRYDKDVVYDGKDSSRTYATICVDGFELDDDTQRRLSISFNEWVEQLRLQTWSLFLPMYREHGRRRIPFELAYRMIDHLLD